MTTSATLVQNLIRRPSRKTHVEEKLIDVLLIKSESQDIAEMLQGDVPIVGMKFHLEWAEGLETGLERLMTCEPNVILLDMAGTKDLEAFHQLQVGAPEIPLVLLLQPEQERLATEALREGAEDYLVEGRFDAHVLMRSLRYAVEKHQLQNALGAMTADHVTGLYNRHSFLILAEQQLKLATRQRGLLVFYAELEEIQRHSPPLTYLEEQRTLIRAANILRKTFRDSDIVARWGRFEFAAVAVDASAESTPLIMSRLQDNLKNFNQRSEPRFRLSLSAGMATLDRDNPATIGHLIGKADAARRSHQGS